MVGLSAAVAYGSNTWASSMHLLYTSDSGPADHNENHLCTMYIASKLSLASIRLWVVFCSSHMTG